MENAVEADVTVDRRLLMAKVKSKNTKPEIKVRQALHASGFRFRLHRGDLPGRPDIILPRYRTAVFVHGCFWHRHVGCKATTTPRTRRGYWQAKFEANVERDRMAVAALEALGWRVVVIWECETKVASKMDERISGIPK